MAGPFNPDPGGFVEITETPNFIQGVDRDFTYHVVDDAAGVLMGQIVVFNTSQDTIRLPTSLGDGPIAGVVAETVPDTESALVQRAGICHILADENYPIPVKGDLVCASDFAGRAIAIGNLDSDMPRWVLGEILEDPIEDVANGGLIAIVVSIKPHLVRPAVDDTFTATGTAKSGGSTIIIDPPGNTIITVPDGEYIGQPKTIFNAGNTNDVVITARFTNHAKGSPWDVVMSRAGSMTVAWWNGTYWCETIEAAPNPGPGGPLPYWSGNLWLYSPGLFHNPVTDSGEGRTKIGTTSGDPQSRLDIRGSLGVETKFVTATPYTPTHQDYTLLCDVTAAGATITVNLPDPAPARRIIIIKLIRKTAGRQVIINPGTANIDDAAGTINLIFDNESITLQADANGDWWVI